MSKTPEELADEYELSLLESQILFLEERMRVRDAYLSGYKAATEWISVKDRLPEGYDLTENDFKPYVLVRDCRHGIHVAAYEHCLKEFRTSATCSAYEESLYCVTHWMPLPDPPKNIEQT
jgi:hypothetical protein